MGSARTRAWRRAQRDRLIAKRTGRLAKYSYRHREQPVGPGQLAKIKGLPESKIFYTASSSKNWKHLYRRSAKTARAQQLRMPYPRREWDSIMHDAIPNEHSLHL